MPRVFQGDGRVFQRSLFVLAAVSQCFIQRAIHSSLKRKKCCFSATSGMVPNAAQRVPFYQHVIDVVSICIFIIVVCVLSHSIAMEVILPIICKVSIAELLYARMRALLTCIHLIVVHQCIKTNLFYTESMILQNVSCKLQKSLKMDLIHTIVKCT